MAAYDSISSIGILHLIMPIYLVSFYTFSSIAFISLLLNILVG